MGNLSKKEILEMIKNRALTPEEGYSLLQKITSPDVKPTYSGIGSKNTEIRKLVLKPAGDNTEKPLEADNYTHSRRKISLRNKELENKNEPENNNKPENNNVSEPLQDNACRTSDIAVIGVSGIFPGADNITEFWNNLKNGVDSVGEIPKDRWDMDLYFDPDSVETGKTYCKWAGMLKEVKTFDSMFFNILPKEAEFIDPQERLFLQEAWHAMEDSGYNPEELSSQRCGVFVGVMGADYRQRTKLSGLGNSFVSTRISYFLNLTGPNMTIDTACSSSLVAIHQACRSILNGECGIALAGGVTVMTTYDTFVVPSKVGMLSRSGKCRTFDNEADGFVPGEGVAVIVLKPLKNALKDGDNIYGVIKGSAVNCDGRTNGITAPSGIAQTALQLEVYERYNIDPEKITYIEAHGTGTKLGDPIEISALKKSFAKYTDKKHYCAIGSVKTNIGHSLAAAGVAGVIKTLLCIKNKKLVPSLNLKKENEHIDFKDSPFYVITETRDWNIDHGSSRMAAVSSFGLSGINCHMVLEEAPELQKNKYAGNKKYPAFLFPFSAKTKEALTGILTSFEKFLDINGEICRLGDVSYTLMRGRAHFKYRCIFTAGTHEELKGKIYKAIKDGSYLPTAGNTDKKAHAGDPAKLDKLSKYFESIKGKQTLNELEYVEKLNEYSCLYIKGEIDNFDMLFIEGQFRRVSLPTYTFAQTRYWLEESNAVSRPESNVKMPLIDRLDIKNSLNTGLVYTKIMRHTLPVISQHKVNKSPVFPAAAYLEMVFEALAKTGDSKNYVLKNIYWQHPLIMELNDIEVQVALREQSGQQTFEISTQRDGKCVIHAKGMLEQVIEETGHALKVFDVEEMKSRCSGFMEAADIYKYFENMGIEYGAYFTGLKMVWANKDMGIGEFELNGDDSSELSDYVLHPAVLDCALQTIGAFAATSGFTSKSTFLPFSVDMVVLKKPLKNKGYAYVQSISEGKFDIAVLEETGQVCVMLYGFQVKELKSIAVPKDSGMERYLFVPVWKKDGELTRQNQGLVNLETGKTLIVYGKDSAALKNAISRIHAGNEIIEAELCNETREVTETYYKIGLNDLNGFTVLKKCLHTIKNVYFLGAVMTSGIDDNNVEDLEESQQRGVLSLFRLIKILDGCGMMEQNINIKIVTNNVLKVLPDDRIIPYAAGVHGLCGAAAKEFPFVSMSIVDISLMTVGEKNKSQYSLEQLAAMLVALKVKSTGQDIALRNGNVYVRKLQPILVGHNSCSPLKEEGVYLILGGTGGIGLELGAYLVRKVHARIVLIGRSEPDEKTKEKMELIESSGGKVLYLKADAGNSDEMKRAVEKAKTVLGHINGVIHSAVVLRDKSLSNMSEADFREALNPKVEGTVNLKNALNDENLDFMLFFSSIQSFSKNAGQSNYAAACTFKDSAALYYQETSNYPVKIVNWGYWGDVGVVSGESYKKCMEEQGIFSISSREGMDVIERLLGSSLEQIIAFKAEDTVLKMMGIDFENRLEVLLQNTPALFKDILQDSEPPVMKVESAKAALDGFSELGRLAQKMLYKAFIRLGLLKYKGEKCSADELMKKLGIKDSYRRFFTQTLKILEEAGYIAIEENKVCVADVGDDGVDVELEKGMELLKKSYPDTQAHLRLLCTCMDKYPEILKGEIQGTEVIFKGSDMELVEGIYRGNNISDHYNRVVSWILVSYLKNYLILKENSPKVKILEVGAGTGGTTASIIKSIKEFKERISYDYTDISIGFVKYGEKNFSKENPYMDFKVLNIESDPVSQRFDHGEYNIVIATNVLHATQDISNTLKNIKRLLKNNGCIVINEATSYNPVATLTFGLLDGWWLYRDEENRIPGSPLLSLEKWKELLEAEGFKNVAFFGDKGQGAGSLGQNIIIAESDGIFSVQEESHKETHKDRENSVNEKETILECKSNRGTHSNIRINSKKTPLSTDRDNEKKVNDDELRHHIEEKVAESIVIALGITRQYLDMEQQFSDYGVDSISGLELIKKLNDTFGVALKTTVIFDKGNAKELSDYIFQEYGAKIKEGLRSEKISGQTAIPLSSWVESNETGQEYKESKPDESAALNNIPKQCEGLAHMEGAVLDGKAQYKSVVLMKPCEIDGICIREVVPRDPGEKEVQVLIKSFSLNFGDYLCIKGLYPTMPEFPFTPGFEFSGIVLKTGRNVTRVKAGDEVIGLTGEGMGAHSFVVNTSEQVVIKKPSKISFDEACAFPVVFLTVHHIFEKAHVRKGEKILIQTAAGGTGLIAVQYALMKGMEVYATAGSTAKLDYLAKLGVKNLINYREEDFEKRIMDMTKGYGVDVLINTLSGEAIQKGLNILAPEGRYMEIAMTALKTSSPLNMSAMVDNQVFYSIDLRKLMLTKPELVTEYMEVMSRYLEEGRIKPVVGKVFGFDKIKDAYTYLVDRNNIGKIVVRTGADYVMDSNRQRESSYDKEAPSGHIDRDQFIRDILKRVEDGELNIIQAQKLMEGKNV